jgi:hypothetical protein
MRVLRINLSAILMVISKIFNGQRLKLKFVLL